MRTSKTTLVTRALTLTHVLATSVCPIKLLLTTVFISIYLPLFASFYDSPSLKVAPVLCLSAIFLFCFEKVQLHLGSLIFFLLLGLLHLINLKTAIANPFGFTLVLVQAYLISKIIEGFLPSFGFFRFNRLIFVGVLVVTGTILFEWILIILGYQNFLASLFSSELMKPYKVANSAFFVNFIWGEYDIAGNTIYGVNSPSLGSQSASQLAFIAVIVAFSLSRLDVRNVKCVLVCLVSVFVFIASVTMTMSIVAALTLIYLLLLDKGCVLNKLKINVPIILALLVFHEHIIGLVFYRIRNPADFEEYITAFNVLDALSNLDTFEFFFGAQSNLLYYTDAGFLGLFYFAGLGLFICWFGFVALEGLRSHLVRNKIYFQKNSWLDEESQLVILNKISFFSVGVCVLGLAHYTTSLELGISQVFSLFLGVLMYTSNLLYMHSKRSSHE